MPKDKAVKYFSGSYNCAQSVIKAFEDTHEVSEDKILEFKKYGGGRAPEGICGALYGALTLCDSEIEISEIEDKFAKCAGSLKCREIRSSKTLSCAECVEKAADIFTKNKWKTAYMG